VLDHAEGKFLVRHGYPADQVPGQSLVALERRRPSRALFFPFIPLAFVSSGYAPVSRLAGWLQPVIHLAAWTLVLAVLPGLLAVRRWQSPA
jgi:hypothetical protein